VLFYLGLLNIKQLTIDTPPLSSGNWKTAEMIVLAGAVQGSATVLCRSHATVNLVLNREEFSKLERKEFEQVDTSKLIHPSNVDLT
jgi:hypothetical protein